MTSKRLEKFTLVLNPDSEYEEHITWTNVRVSVPFDALNMGSMFEMTISVAKIEEPKVPVTLPEMLPVIVDTDWRWSYEYEFTRWELQKYYAGKWHMTYYWRVGPLFENPAALRENVQKILRQAGVHFSDERPLIEPDPELDRLLAEEEEIEARVRQSDEENPPQTGDEGYVEGL